MIGSSQNFLEEILTRNFLGIEVVLKFSLFFSLEMVVGRSERTVANLHITVAVGGPFGSIVLERYNCCCWPL